MTPEFCAEANATVFPIAQIEHVTAVKNIDAILAVPGLAAVMIGPMDLSGSMGYPVQPNHPKVIEAIDHVIEQSRKAKVYVGMGVTDDPQSVRRWLEKGVSMLYIAPDYMLLLRAAKQFVDFIREQQKSRA